MAGVLPRARFLGLGLLMVSLAALTLSSRGRGQPPKEDEPDEKILGANACIACHEKPSARWERQKVTDFIRLDESAIWEKRDLHGKAFESLKQPLGQQMAKVLSYDVTKAPQCLSCHSVDLEPAKKLASKTLKDFYTDVGVSCEGCHGFANKWNTPHISLTWRERDPAYKEARGQWDMRNPLRRAERCASCHVGNESEGRFVTHEMYAAGHPPLPSLEVASFSRDEPMHYKYAKDLPYLVELAKNNPEKSWKLFHFRGAQADSQVARQLAVGAIMTLRANAKLLADKAAGIDPTKDALDLAHFDCYACHHDLQSDSWRRERGFVGVPGRPQIRPGVALLAKIVADHAADATNAEAHSSVRRFPQFFKAITNAFDARPFGVPADVAKAANVVIAWCDDVLRRLDDVRYTPEETKKLLKLFVEAGQKPPTGKTNPYLDADAAQQLVWACESLRLELEPVNGPIGELLAELKGQLPQHVRNTENNDLIAGQLDARFKRQYSFEPGELYKTFAKLQEKLK